MSGATEALGTAGHEHEIERGERSGRTELAISYLLRAGVMTSLLLVVAGTIVSFVHHPDYLHSSAAYAKLTAPRASPFHTVGDIAYGLSRLQGQALVGLGLLVLVATPVLRVAASVVLFLIQRDRMFVAITCLVLTLLVISFLLGKAGG